MIHGKVQRCMAQIASAITQEFMQGDTSISDTK